MTLMRMTGKAARVAVMGAGLLVAGSLAVRAGEPAAAQELCGAVEEALRLLEENQLEFGNGAAKQAVLEAVIRAGEPAVQFLDEAAVAARSQRLAEREWSTGLTLVATDGLPKVAAVRAESPAAAAGIVAGELLEKIGGRELLSGTGLKHVRGWLAEGESAELAVGVRAADSQSRVVELQRVRQAESALADVEELPAAMGYLRVAGIFPGAGAEIAGVLERWQGATVSGAILDLRGVAGTAEEEIPAVAARFAPMGRMLYTVSDRKGRELATVPAPPAPKASLPLMVLVDEETTGAAELLAAVLGGSVKGAMIIGRPTAGDPLLREPRPLSTGRHALLATRQVQTADGAVYAGNAGLQPDVLITDAALNETVYEPEMPVLRKGKTLTDEEKEDKALRERTRNDTYLRRATDVLLGLRALGYDRPR
jgi:carboxyl-terminal processing protease